MTQAVYMLAAYGVAFIILHKLLTWRSWHWRDLFQCAFCLGVWTGAILWGLSWAVDGVPVFPPASGGVVSWGLSGGVWVLACGSVSLLIETVGGLVDGEHRIN